MIAQGAVKLIEPPNGPRAPGGVRTVTMPARSGTTAVYPPMSRSHARE
jgi:hypothetical protein